MATWIKRYDNSMPGGFSYVQLEDYRTIAVFGSDSTWNVQGIAKTTNISCVFGPVSFSTQAEADALLADVFHAIGAIDPNDYA